MDPPEKAAAAVRSPGKGTTATTLLDVYEVEWITRELERLLVRETACGGGGGVGDGHHRRKRTKVVVGTKAAPSTEKKGGFLAELLGRHAVSVCGDTAAVVGGRARRGRGSFREVGKVPHRFPRTPLATVRPVKERGDGLGDAFFSALPAAFFSAAAFVRVFPSLGGTTTGLDQLLLLPHPHPHHNGQILQRHQLLCDEAAAAAIYPLRY
uniref:Uncharacterized protein n=1 Tax=Leersia perrieri TaxID=77586 RepID=A0A0D9VKQ8_9ORYZ